MLKKGRRQTADPWFVYIIGKHRQALRLAYEEVGVTGVPMFMIALQNRETLEAMIEEESG